MRFELPDDISPRERAAVEAALRRYVESFAVRPSPWSLAGRAETTGIGALQIRHQSLSPWNETRLNRYTRLGTAVVRGRGDAK